jgi:hypothetical protein
MHPQIVQLYGKKFGEHSIDLLMQMNVCSNVAMKSFEWNENYVHHHQWCW